MGRGRGEDIVLLGELGQRRVQARKTRPLSSALLLAEPGQSWPTREPSGAGGEVCVSRWRGEDSGSGRIDRELPARGPGERAGTGRGSEPFSPSAVTSVNSRATSTAVTLHTCLIPRPHCGQGTEGC